MCARCAGIDDMRVVERACGGSVRVHTRQPFYLFPVPLAVSEGWKTRGHGPTSGAREPSPLLWSPACAC